MRSSPAARWTLALALAAAVVGACRQTIGIDQYYNAGVSTSVCGLSYGTTTCTSCANTNCCSESTTCAADPSCASYASCFGQCNGDPKCWASCRSGYPTTTPPVSALSACMAKSCETECRLTCGALAGYRIAPDAATACQSCLVNSACSATRACAASTKCDAVNRCLSTCQTSDCYQACDVANGFDPAFSIAPDAGKGTVYATYWTARSSCSAQCEVGSDWSCVGHVSWPTPKSATITWHLWAKDAATGLPTAGANVSVCSGPADCAVPFATAVTDTSGAASLHFQNVTGVGSLNFGLSGFLWITSPSIVPLYMYWGFPLSDAQIYTNAGPVTPAEFQQFYTAAGAPQDPNRGVVAAVLFDCQGNTAPGVMVALDTADAMTRSLSFGAVAATTTDSSGILLFANVPPGAFQLTATPVALGKVASKVSGYVGGQTDTVMLMYPTP